MISISYGRFRGKPGIFEGFWRRKELWSGECFRGGRGVCRAERATSNNGSAGASLFRWKDDFVEGLRKTFGEQIEVKKRQRPNLLSVGPLLLAKPGRFLLVA
jgi:hypothetical protein